MATHLLALETSGARCGVALLRAADGTPQILARHHDGVAEHSERLLAMVDALLAEAGLAAGQLDAIAFGQGPGGFTGLRVACGVAQGMGFALQRPLIAVTTHEAMEWPLRHQAAGWRLVVQDARMDERYVAIARRTPGLALAAWEQAPVLLPAAVLLPWWEQWRQGRQAAERGAAEQGAHDWLLAADLPLAAEEAPPGMACWPEAVAPSAAAVAEVAWQRWQDGVRLDAAEAHPLYVRDKVAFTTAERAAGAGGNPRAALPEQAGG